MVVVFRLAKSISVRRFLNIGKHTERPRIVNGQFELFETAVMEIMSK